MPPIPVRAPRAALALVAIVTVGLCAQIHRVRVDSAMESIFLQDDELERYREFRDEFGDDEIIVAGIRVRESDVFHPTILHTIARITAAIEALPEEYGVDRVVSLTNVHDVSGRGGTIAAGLLIPEIPERDADVRALRERALANPLFVRNLVSPDGRSAAINVLIAHRPGNLTLKETLVQTVRSIGKVECRDVDCVFAGIPVLTHYTSEYMRRDMLLFVPVTVLVIAIILWVTFRSALGVLLPLTTVGLAVVWTVGFVGLIGRSITIVASAVPSLLLAVGVAYSLHVVAQYYQESAHEPTERVSQTLRRVMRPVVGSGLTTFIGFGALVFSEVPQVRDFGIYAAFGVASATFLAVVLVPACLSFHRGRMPRMAAPGRVAGPVGRALEGVGAFAVRRRVAVVAVGAVVAAASLWGAAAVKVDTDYAAFFKRGSEPLEGLAFMRNHLAGERPINVVVRTRGERLDGVLEPQVLRLLEDIEQTLTAHPLVASSLSIVGYLKNMHHAVRGGEPAGREFASGYGIPDSRELAKQYLAGYARPHELGRLMSPDGNAAIVIGRSSIISSDEFLGFVSDLRRRYGHADEQGGRQATALPAAEVSVTGSMYLLSKASIAIPRDMRRSIALASLLIALVFFVWFRSVTIALIGIGANLLPVLTYFGFMTLAGITLNTGTAVIASIALGIAVDDTMHFLTRYQERRQREGAADAARATVRTAGRAMLFTTVATACGFLVLTLSSFTPLVALGWLTAATMVSALLADTIVLPAMLSLFDRTPRSGVGLA